MNNSLKYNARQVSSIDENNKHILSVVTKKTYRIDVSGRCIRAEKDIPLFEDIVYYEGTNNTVLEHDMDLYPYKPKTDVVIKGHAQGNWKKNCMEINLQIENYKTSISVFGNRKALLNKNKVVVFSDPEPVEKIPLRYDYAYGGWDRIGEGFLERFDQEIINSFPEEIEWEMGSPYRYPRNPHGKGFLVHLNKHAVDLLELPNLEDSIDRLTPQRLAAGSYLHWTKMPVPRCTDWMDITWFPRFHQFGIGLYESSLKDSIVEAKRGWVGSDILEDKPPEVKFDFSCMNGASLGLQLPYLVGGEKVCIINVHPSKRKFQFTLPVDIPQIWVDGRKGKLIETKPKLQSVIIEPEEDRVSLVWRGSGPAIRPYMNEELEEMPFEVNWVKK